MTRLATYLVAGQAVYRVIESDDTGVRCEIVAGSDRVRGREVTVPRSQIQAAIDLGEMRATRSRPRIIDEQMQRHTASKLEQEAALTTAKAAHWKGTKPDEPTGAARAATNKPAGRTGWEGV